MTAPAWQRRFTAARVSLPVWAEDAPSRATYATNASGLWQVMSWDIDSDRHTQVTDKASGVMGGRPTPDGDGVIWFDDAAGDEVGRYVVTRFFGGTASPLVEGIGDGWSAGLSWRRDRIAVGVADRGGFRLGAQINGDYRELYSSSHPASISGLSKDARQLAISHTEHGDSIHPALRILDPTTGETLAERWDGPGNSVSAAGWSPLAGDQRLAVLADRSGRTRPEIWLPESGETIGFDLDLPGEVWVAAWEPDGAALLLAHDHLGRVELHRYLLQEGRAELLALGSGSVGNARVRDDGSLWYAFVSSAKPPQVRVRRADGSDEILLAPPGEPPPGGVAYESIHYANGDGADVHAFAAFPRGEGPFPLVVDIHGGPHAQATDTFDAEVQAWVDHGFAVLQPNYRGSTGYGKAWEDALIGDPGRPELVDARAGRDHLVEQGRVDPERVVLSGASWGGYITLQGLGTQPETWSAGVAVVPVADYVAAFEDESPGLQEFDRSLFGGTPDDLGALYRERSPITYVDDVAAPVLIITGANDTRCPKRQVDNYVEALHERGKTVAYDVFEAGHGSLDVAERIREVGMAIDFVAEHLGTPPAQR